MAKPFFFHGIASAWCIVPFTHHLALWLACIFSKTPGLNYDRPGLSYVSMPVAKGLGSLA